MYTEQEILALKNRIGQLEQEKKTPHETVEFLTHKLFGRNSEKTSVIADQINLFNEAEIESILLHQNQTCKKYQTTNVRSLRGKEQGY